jgi:hypothetical protein
MATATLATSSYVTVERAAGGTSSAVSLSGTLPTMGTGLLYAIAAKLAHPDRLGIALMSWAATTRSTCPRLGGQPA